MKSKPVCELICPILTPWISFTSRPSANRNDHCKPGDRSADLGFRLVAVMDE